MSRQASDSALASKSVGKQRVGKYQLGKTLGTGTWGKVKIAFDTELKTNFAIKMVDRKLVEQEGMEEHLEREIDIMKRLQHPYVVEMREVLRTERSIYIVMELVTGGELFDKIVKARRFDETMARKYFQQLCLGVQYCHTRGVSHRDLKPENLLVDGNDNLKITDFGLSAITSGDSSKQRLLMTTCGTPNYVAPEVLLERGYKGYQTDVWSIGVILFVMLAGYLPFDDSSMNVLFDKIKRAQYSMPKHFTAGARLVIQKCLIPDPEKRCSLDELIKDPWVADGLVNQVPKMKEDDASSNPSTEPKKEDTKAITTVREGTQQITTHAPPVTTSVAPSASSGDDIHKYLNAFELGAVLFMGPLYGLVAASGGAAPKRATRFVANGSLSQLTASMEKILSDLKLNPKKTEKGHKVGISFKCNTTEARGVLTFTCKVQPTVASDLVFVELRRGRGDVLEFNSIFRKVVDSLGPSVVPSAAS